MSEFDHLRVTDPAQARDFRSNLSVRKPTPPARDRMPHGRRLLAQLAALRRREAPADGAAPADAPAGHGMAIALEIKPKGFLDFQRLEWRRDGIEVLNVSPGQESDIVVLFVPDGGLSALEKRITAYLERETTAGVPHLASLVNVIENIRRAAFDELWTDAAEPPASEVRQWFQLWLRLHPEGPGATLERFVEHAEQFGITTEPGYLTFPGRVVVAVRATRSALEENLATLDAIAEIRSVQPTADFFLADLTPAEQADWVRNLAGRTTHASDAGEPPYVALFDTGVNYGHPLLQQALADEDARAIDPAWPTTDHHGHGTQMAGLVVHGNLVDPLAASDTYDVRHRLESVNILPQVGQNAPHLYGWITEKATQEVEVPHPHRRRTFAMMVSALGQTTGAPSEWSAKIDQLAFAGADPAAAEEGIEAQTAPRLYVLAAGNVQWNSWQDYPTVNLTSTVENPGQAWNALTVGSYTDLVTVDAEKWPSFQVIAQQGGMSPSTTTSLLWPVAWPYKPDVVAEGGNGCLDHGQVIAGPDSLRLLTTNHEMATALLTDTGDTSAAAAEVARLCARISDRYPDYWPETVRAMVVHGARYTPRMRTDLPKQAGMLEKRNLLKRYGYGAIDPTASLVSTERRPTLIVQDTIVPYRLHEGAIKLNVLNLHSLPWPADALRELAEATVELRITLSYFIDPNPSQRGWQSKFRYQSHGLRFAVKGSTESLDEFNQRINRIDRDAAAGEEEAESMTDADASGWFLGTKLQNRGSLHSDVWTGTAVQLAEKSHVAIFPVGGWWKDWKGAGHPDKAVRYAFVASLHVAQDIDVDLYTPILAQIQVPVVLPIPLV